MKDTAKRSHFNNNEGEREFETMDGFSLQDTLNTDKRPRKLIKLQTETNAETKIGRHTILLDRLKNYRSMKFKMRS